VAGGSWRERAERIATRLEMPLLLPTARNRRLVEALALLDERVRRMIADRRRAGGGTDLLAVLLAAQADGGERMTDRQLRDEILTLFVAGHETTATALAWGLYLVARTPSVRARLEEEIAALDPRPLTHQDLPRLPFTAKVFKEALRMYPPVPL